MLPKKIVLKLATSDSIASGKRFNYRPTTIVVNGRRLRVVHNVMLQNFYTYNKEKHVLSRATAERLKKTQHRHTFLVRDTKPKSPIVRLVDMGVLNMAYDLDLEFEPLRGNFFCEVLALLFLKRTGNDVKLAVGEFVAFAGDELKNMMSCLPLPTPSPNLMRNLHNLGFYIDHAVGRDLRISYRNTKVLKEVQFRDKFLRLEPTGIHALLEGHPMGDSEFVILRNNRIYFIPIKKDYTWLKQRFFTALDVGTGKEVDLFDPSILLQKNTTIVVNRDVCRTLGIPHYDRIGNARDVGYASCIIRSHHRCTGTSAFDLRVSKRHAATRAAVRTILAKEKCRSHTCSKNVLEQSLKKQKKKKYDQQNRCN